MKTLPSRLVGILFLVVSSFAAAAEPPSAAALLDEAIWWPGDYGQVCTDGSGYGSLYEPWMHGFRTIVPQEYYLSKDVLARLKERKAEVVAEIVRRLKVLDWQNPPKGDPVSEKVRHIEKAESDKLMELEKRTGPIPTPGPRRHENNRMLGATLLRIIEGLDAVEALPELLRLEQQLAELNEAAMKASWNKKPEKILLPTVEIGWRGISWDGYTDMKDSPRKKLLERVFENTVFEMEMLGVCLGMMQRRGWKPLQESLIGHLYRLSEKRHPAAYLPFTKGIREQIRTLVTDFIAGKETPAKPVQGAALLDEVLVKPGSWNQMCAYPPPVPVPVPMAPQWELASRHFNLGGEMVLRLQAYREVVMPVLGERLKRMSIADSAIEKDDVNFPSNGSGQDGKRFGPLILQIVDVLQSSECLEDLLRLEQELSEFLAKAEKDATQPVPKLLIDSPVFIRKGTKQEQNAHILRIYQRELLGLIKTLLLREEYEPMSKSALMAAQLAADKAEFEKVARQVKKSDDIPWHLSRHMGWNEKDNEIYEKHNDDAIMQTPYSEAVREEIRQIADDFVHKVPAAQRKGADAMPLSWLNF